MEKIYEVGIILLMYSIIWWQSDNIIGLLMKLKIIKPKMKETTWNYIYGLICQLVIVGITLAIFKKITFAMLVGMLFGIIIIASIFHLMEKREVTSSNKK